MKVAELHQIYKLMNSGGLIGEITIEPQEDGTIKVIGADAAKTFFTIFKSKVPVTIAKKISIENIKGIDEIAKKFTNSELTIIDNKLHMSEGTKFANIILKEAQDLGINLPPLTDDHFDIISRNIDHNRLKALGGIRSDSVINEEYHFYIMDENLFMRAGGVSDNNIGDSVSKCDKSTPEFTIKFTMNVSPCFSNIFTNASIYMIKDKIMIVECDTETYNVRYHLAPRVDD